MPSPVLPEITLPWPESEPPIRLPWAAVDSHPRPLVGQGDIAGRVGANLVPLDDLTGAKPELDAVTVVAGNEVVDQVIARPTGR